MKVPARKLQVNDMFVYGDIVFEVARQPKVVGIVRHIGRNGKKEAVEVYARRVGGRRAVAMHFDLGDWVEMAPNWFRNHMAWYAGHLLAGLPAEDVA